jgi:hypothetical protein
MIPVVGALCPILPAVASRIHKVLKRLNENWASDAKFVQSRLDRPLQDTAPPICQEYQDTGSNARPFHELPSFSSIDQLDCAVMPKMEMFGQRPDGWLGISG